MLRSESKPGLKFESQLSQINDNIGIYNFPVWRSQTNDNEHTGTGNNACHCEDSSVRGYMAAVTCFENQMIPLMSYGLI